MPLSATWDTKLQAAVGKGDGDGMSGICASPVATACEAQVTREATAGEALRSVIISHGWRSRYPQSIGRLDLIDMKWTDYHRSSASGDALPALTRYNCGLDAGEINLDMMMVGGIPGDDDPRAQLPFLNQDEWVPPSLPAQ